MIYLDNAATTINKPPEVAQAIVKAMESMGNAARGAHSVSLNASRIVYDTRVKIANLSGCQDPSHVVFTSNATEALNIAIFGTLSSKDHVISTDYEHNSVLRPLYALEDEKKMELDFVRADNLGHLCYEDFERLIKPNTKAVVCTHCSNLTGDLVDVKRVRDIAKANHLLFILDGSQTLGTIPINMQELEVDILCFTGHKGLMGPQGTGGLCIANGVEISPWKRGGTGIQSYNRQHPSPYPARLEAGTLNSHGIAGLSAALDFIEKTGIETIHRHEQELMNLFYEGVKNVEGVKVYGDFSKETRSAIVTINIRDYDSGAVADVLSEKYHIATRPGAHCAPRLHKALNTKEQGAIRFSFSWYNTKKEIVKAVEAVREIAK